MRGFDPDIIGNPGENDRLLYEFPGGWGGRRSYSELKPKIAAHGAIWKWLSTFADRPDIAVLEVGSRSVVSDSHWKKFIPNSNYTGFDMQRGRNVDVVGDAHRLSDYFPAKSFDVVVSFAVFEHLAMPWIVAEEIAKVLKVGGCLAMETHFSHSEHEYPAHFFQFNEHGLRMLFSESIGFQLIDSGMDTPIVGRFSIDAPLGKKGHPIYSLYCHSSIIAKKVKDIDFSTWNWRACLAKMNSDHYPKGTGKWAQENSCPTYTSRSERNSLRLLDRIKAYIRRLLGNRP